MSTREEKERVDLLQGTLDLLILRTLRLRPAHGHAIAKAIECNSDEVFEVGQGSLYPALVRMRRRGWVKTSWRITENGRRARYYELTSTGRKALSTQHSAWARASAAIDHIMSVHNWALEGA